MKNFVDRIKNEKQELDEKLDSLGNFIASDAFDKLEIDSQRLLLAQQGTMARYSNILRDRLALLGE